MRKQVALLQSKIAAAAEQEKAVIVRLGELYVEMQSRERWARARAEALQGCYFPVMPPGGPVCGAPVPGSWVPVAEKPASEEVSIRPGLSPLSPEFVPGWARGESPRPVPDVPVPPEQ